MSARATALLACAASVAALVAPALADAANRRVAISDFRWSVPDVQIDLGEHVTWHWIGPDTAHSITGNSLNAAGLDSDPGTSFPNHQIGDSFKLDFLTPGTYEFHCKLHKLVKGEVTVSSNPGDPLTEVDPIPESLVDLQAPVLTDVSLGRTLFRRDRGTALRFSLDERALVDAEIYRLPEGRKPVYAGYREWSAHIGLNSVKFGGPSKHFNARPGRYRATLYGEDEAANQLKKPRRVSFTIVKKPRK